MRTLANFEKIAAWMGWEKEMGHWYAPGPTDSRGRVADKTSLTDAEAVEALNRLVEKGYEYSVGTRFKPSGVGVLLGHFLSPGASQVCVDTGAFPPIAAAVEAAILQLAEVEVKEG